MPASLSERIHGARVSLYKAHDLACRHARMGLHEAYLVNQESFDAALKEMNSLADEVAEMERRLDETPCPMCVGSQICEFHRMQGKETDAR